MCIVFFSVAVGEEVLSRGYLFGLLNYHFSRTTAIIVSSLLFALLHSLNPGVWSNPIPMIELILAGILLAVLRVISGGLWLPIGFHLTWNLFQGNVYGFKVSGLNVSSFIQNVPEGSVWVSGGQFGAEGSVIGFIVTLCAIGIFYYYGLRSRQST
jgi:membrane protease YdiL (CAAX protease family)